ncbi:MAG: lamin tail domain-containing protein [Candidatus Paceibacterota bacterium]
MSLQDAKKKIRALFAKIKPKAAVKKLSAALMIVSIALANTPMSYTVAKLVDTEISGGNIFGAGTLDQSLSSGADFSPAVLPGSVVATKDMAIANNGSLGFQYTIFATNTIGALCDSLNLQATLDGVSVYNGPLKLFSYEVADYSPTAANWHFEASLPNGASYILQNQTCNLDFNVLAKQKDLVSGVGFSDLETMPNAILAGTWKIEGIWVQTTEADFNAGTPSYDCCGKKEIAVSPATDGTGDVSIAAGGEIPPMTASFSGDNDGQHIPSKAIDGDTATYWKATQASDADWFGVDYGMLYPVAKIEIDFHHPHIPYKYRVEVSPTCAYAGEQVIVKSSSNNNSSFLTIEFTERMIKCARIVFLDTSGNPAIDEFTSFKRELPWFDGTATLQSQTFDSGKITKWTKLEWDETLVNGTDIAFSVQTSNDASNWSSWKLKSSTSPIDLSTLPQTRYIRWKADLTSDTFWPPISTPILHEARVFYEQEEAQKFVVLNEYLPYPSSTTWGHDSSFKPKGEWIELYNNGSSAVDLDGFYFQNALGTKKYISKATAFITTNTGDTIINSHDWLVVYMNGEFMSNGGDTIAFYDLFGNPVDSHTFDTTNACTILPTPDATNSAAVSGTCTTVPANKSFARIPDGTGSWVDPIPTPGSANVLEVVPMDEFADKLNDLLIVPTSSEATTTQEAPELPMEGAGGSTPTPEIVDTLPTQPGLAVATSSEEIATTTLPTSTEAINSPELATNTPEIIPETAPATTTPSVEDTQAATTTPEVIIEPAASVPAPAPVVAEVSTPVEPQPATDETQMPEVLSETPATPEPQPENNPEIIAEAVSAEQPAAPEQAPVEPVPAEPTI